MKVYLLAKNWGYDGYEVVDIYASEELAILGAKGIMDEEDGIIWREKEIWKEIEVEERFVKKWKRNFSFPIIEVEEREVIE